VNGRALKMVLQTYNKGMDWHARYNQQAQWTAQLRSYLYKKAGLDDAGRLLEIGCGTGAVLADFPVRAGVFGMDLSLPALRQAFIHAPGASLCGADASHLPFANGAFDMLMGHFVLLWVSDPLQVVKEMRRVTRAGGAVLALAEPDYGGRIDFPEELAEAGRWQAESLRRQGADPLLGRKLAGIFTRAGLRNVQTGVLAGEWKNAPGGSLTDNAQSNLEWDVMAADLAGKVAADDIQRLRRVDELARQRGERVLFVPTFYAWGVV
jgi:ubiquinone/menaquinone biosynthesis C-methylase UbiE